MGPLKLAVQLKAEIQELSVIFVLFYFLALRRPLASITICLVQCGISSWERCLFLRGTPASVHSLSRFGRVASPGTARNHGRDVLHERGGADVSEPIKWHA